MVATANNKNTFLTDRWTVLKFHAIQARFRSDPHRFKVASAGRRSGKTEIAKRHLVLKALAFYTASNGWFVAAAPTHRQAKQIFWDDLKALVPRRYLLTPDRPEKSISESNLHIRLYNGAKIQVLGLDVPARIEGPPLDGIILDEYGNMKPDVWTQHVRPSLSTIGRPGWAWFIGVPEGRNHYFELHNKGLDSLNLDWGSYTWPTKDINPEEAELAKGDMDVLTYEQEYEGAFVTFAGRAYYSFNKEWNVTPEGIHLKYDPKKPLIFTFDFNRRPGVALVLQEQSSPSWLDKINNNKHFDEVTCGIDEVFIENGSNTEVVSQRLASRWGHHKGEVHIYGDATGGAKKSAGVKGSDWDLVEATLAITFGSRLWSAYAKSNPLVRTRLNSTNSRFRTVDKLSHGIFDRVNCPMAIRDFEGVACDDQGGIDEKDKKGMLTHMSDAYGYYVDEVHPCGGAVMQKNSLG